MLTAAPGAAVEKAKVGKEAQGEFESAWPGYCGAQETFSVGPVTGGGRLYPQTFVDTYSKGAFATLYDPKTSLPAAELRNEQVGPFFESPEIRLSRLRTARGPQ